MPIQDIHLHRLEVKLADTDDPVAQRVDWGPAIKGGASFRQQTLVEVSPDLLLVKPTFRHTLFCSVFLLLGSVVPGFMAYLALQRGQYGPVAIAAGVALVFCGVGVLMLRSNQPLRLDRRSGYYLRGSARLEAETLPRASRGRLAEVHALQIVAETLESKHARYRSYELNFVFPDGGRVNVMDHGDLPALERDALRLGAFLDVPVWRGIL